MTDPNPFLARRRRSRRRRAGGWIAAAALVLLGFAAWRVSGLLGVDPGAVTPASRPDSAEPAVRVRLPADDGPHRSLMEWWYYNGHLRTAEGREFSFHCVAFLVNSVVPYTALQASLVDHRTGRRVAHQKGSPGNPSAGSGAGFDFRLDSWHLTGSGGKDRLKVQAPGLGFDLGLSNPGPTVFHGGTGLLDFGAAGTSYYYSRPRMAVTGTLTLDGTSVPVEGLAWFDHQWGDFQPLDLGWDWFSLQLDDGSDVMLYRLRGRDGRSVLISGTWTRDGASETLQAGEFSLEATRSWTSPATGIPYPIAWTLSIPSRRLEATLEPVAEACEFDARGSTLMTYWEGAVRVRGSHAGRGFVEICPLRPLKPGP